MGERGATLEKVEVVFDAVVGGTVDYCVGGNFGQGLHGLVELLGLGWICYVCLEGGTLGLGECTDTLYVHPIRGWGFSACGTPALTAYGCDC